MKVIQHPSDKDEPLQKPVVLTIGMFDGMHLGHQSVLSRVKEISQAEGYGSAVFTFENHPAEVLRPDKKIPLLCSLDHKKNLMEKNGIDLLILAQFTREFSHQTSDVFLSRIRTLVPFNYLILGHDAAIGKDRHGNREIVQALAKQLQFEVEYLDPVFMDDQPVSSTKIRHLIQEGKLNEADKLLGRRFSIRGQVIKGMGLGKKLGYPTANISVHGLCLPPLGIYAVTLFCDGRAMPGAANLGFAPTVRNDKEPILEVHLLDCDQELYGRTVEVVFEEFIRQEKQFNSLDDLKNQIAKDIEWTKNHFKSRAI